ncbi:MAG: hypothetical protein H0V27_09295 [Pyrinomonadaceae bacterium]|nr:hypothetical protein [Pyrinomonadaceae bacterium]
MRAQEWYGSAWSQGGRDYKIIRVISHAFDFKELPAIESGEKRPSLSLILFPLKTNFSGWRARPDRVRKKFTELPY